MSNARILNASLGMLKTSIYFIRLDSRPEVRLDIEDIFKEEILSIKLHRERGDYRKSDAIIFFLRALGLKVKLMKSGRVVLYR